MLLLLRPSTSVLLSLSLLFLLLTYSKAATSRKHTQADMQFTYCDQTRQLPKPSLTTGAISQLVLPAYTPRLSRSKPTTRAAGSTFTQNAPHAKLAKVQGRVRTPVLRCAATKHAEDSQDLQSQVNRLTALLNTLQAATDWHDKASLFDCISPGRHLNIILGSCYARRYLHCKMSLAYRAFSQITST